MKSLPLETDTLIIGGGLSGLSLARGLSAAGIGHVLIEARDRLGGRILSLASHGDASPSDRHDLGPSWFWPGQPLIEELLQDLGLEWFEQAADGNLVLQEADGSIQRDLAFATMGGSRRIVGGIQSVIEGITSELRSDKLFLNHRLTALSATKDGVIADVATPEGATTLTARHAVVALPPRLALDTMVFSPALPASIANALSAVPTWMAGHAKFVAIYDRPFWRDAGLSGDAISRLGPLAEIHDASPASGREGALFGFLGIPADARAGRDNDIIETSIAQLAALFGEAAGTPKSVLYRDWHAEPFTATLADAVPLFEHPIYGPVPTLPDPWNLRLLFTSTETAPVFGGLLEGALFAAKETTERIIAAQ